MTFTIFPTFSGFIQKPLEQQMFTRGYNKLIQVKKMIWHKKINTNGVNYWPALSLSDMQTPLQVPLCLWRHNQETSDAANSEALISHPGRGWSLQTYPRSTSRNKPLTKRNGCTSQPLKAQPSNKGGSRSLAHITHDWTPADMGSPLQNEGLNPWELLTPLCLDMLSLFWLKHQVTA